jgi:hypothetical protein
MESLLDYLPDSDTLNDEEEPEVFHPSSYHNVDEFIDLLKSKQNVFTVISLNIQSLNAKLDQLRLYVEMFKINACNVSAICLQETWLDDTSDLSYFEIPVTTLLVKIVFVVEMEE